MPDLARPRTLRRRIQFVVTLTVATIAIFEVVARVAVAVKLGPRAFLYGTPLARDTLRAKKREDKPWHEQLAESERGQQLGAGAGYTKYFPHQKKDGYDAHGRRYDVTINSHGFRGREFELEKTPGAMRIAAIGASSTFGYHDRDDETWPWYLEVFLDERLAKEPVPGVTDVEVLNLGIPHLASDQLLALFEGEALRFAPDVVVVYEGVNDTRRLAVTAGEKALHAAARCLVLARFVYEVATPLFTSFSRAELDAALAGKREFFLANLARMRDGCRERDIRFVVVLQAAHSETFTREELGRVGHADEVAQLRAELAAGGRITLRQLQFLIHAELMAALAEWAAREQVEWVDGIAALERAGCRGALLSWVHLAPEGNRALASAIADQVFPAAER